MLIAPGWKILFGKSLDEDDDAPQALPTLKQGQICQISDSEIKTLQTSPPNHFTEGTLLTAMKNAARFVTDERLKQRLRETEGLEMCIRDRYSTGTSIYINTYCTGNADEIDWPTNIQFSSLEKTAIMPVSYTHLNHKRNSNF